MLFPMDDERAEPGPSQRTPGAEPSEAAQAPAGGPDSLPGRDIDLSRRVVPVLGGEGDDICSICLDEYSAADNPGCETACG